MELGLFEEITFFSTELHICWVTCGVKMMWLCHGWGWQSPQTASQIHMRHQKVFEHIDMCDFAIAVITRVSMLLLCRYLHRFVAGNSPWHHCPHHSGIVAPPANVLGLSIEEKDLLFCTCIGRWPLPLPFYLCNWPLQEKGNSIPSPQQQAHKQDPRGCV